MSPGLYLDTARLGQMCSGARRAEQDFLRLVSQRGSLLYLETFLAEGYWALPAKLRRRYPHLRCWEGVAGFSKGLGQFIGQPAELPISFFSQSRSLIRYAGECLFRESGNVLTTDLEWPAYLSVLRQLARERGARLHLSPLRQMFLQSQLSPEDVVDILREHYERRSCDGIFLSDISYLGMRLPIEEFLDSIRSSQRPFVVIDGAQALNHRPVDLSVLGCDLYLAGTQKWFQSYHPLRMAVVGRKRHLSLMEQVRTQQKESAPSADPLFSFCNAVQSGDFRVIGETVNIAGLIAAAGSLRQHQRAGQEKLHKWHTRLSNAKTLAQWLADSMWRPIFHPETLQSGILLLRPRNRIPMESETQARAILNRFGLTASVFSGGLVRLSMPSVDLPFDQITMVIRALHHLASNAAARPSATHLVTNDQRNSKPSSRRRAAAARAATVYGGSSEGPDATAC